MKISGNITFNYANEKDAKLVFDCLEVDNEDYLESDLSDTLITYKITSKNLGSFLATADDLIASEIVSEKIIENTKK
ncbi:KEOPS complex subunit Pcc1 [Methanobrevibacter sp.]|uniref:KEOPS complex subunit Pcc1 n=1 Tax=Methanobrevibacter sp. TaxID=66852 RepID=UPI0026DF8EC2|nr:KEOPS complex subunit Pcc1 [Methanobrevibacter sp.]MDO5860978.1 KEOPS complex subunit Pcc1 [Methanobrevibacter sp.]